MQEAVPLGKGTMAAIIGLSPEEVQTICEEAREDEVLSLANLNCPGQIVIAGHTPAVDRAMRRATERDALKVVRLAVSAPFHSQLMGPAAERLAQALEDIPVYDLQVPVISNADAEYYPSKDNIKALLVKQVDHPVRWEESMRRMASDGVDQIIEVGPGRVLSGLMRRITRDVKTFSFESPEGAAKLPKT
jgi:[acyl-carrier-protein] S-malonyltransferase